MNNTNTKNKIKEIETEYIAFKQYEKCKDLINDAINTLQFETKQNDMGKLVMQRELISALLTHKTYNYKPYTLRVLKQMCLDYKNEVKQYMDTHLMNELIKDNRIEETDYSMISFEELVAFL